MLMNKIQEDGFGTIRLHLSRGRGLMKLFTIWMMKYKIFLNLILLSNIQANDCLSVQVLYYVRTKCSRKSLNYYLTHQFYFPKIYLGSHIYHPLLGEQDSHWFGCLLWCPVTFSERKNLQKTTFQYIYFWKPENIATVTKWYFPTLYPAGWNRSFLQSKICVGVRRNPVSGNIRVENYESKKTVPVECEAL